MKAKLQNDNLKLALDLLITKNKTNPMLGLDWMEKLIMNLSSENNVKIQNITDDKNVNEMKKLIKILFNKNHTINGIEVYIGLKPGRKTIQKKQTNSNTSIGGSGEKQPGIV